MTFPYGKGSAAAPMVLLELSKQGTAPWAIITIEIDPLLVAGTIISKHFYGKAIPMVLLSASAFDQLKTGQLVCLINSHQLCLINEPINMAGIRKGG